MVGKCFMIWGYLGWFFTPPLKSDDRPINCCLKSLCWIMLNPGWGLGQLEFRMWKSTRITCSVRFVDDSGIFPETHQTWGLDSGKMFGMFLWASWIAHRCNTAHKLLKLHLFRSFEVPALRFSEAKEFPVDFLHCRMKRPSPRGGRRNGTSPRREWLMIWMACSRKSTSNGESIQGSLAFFWGFLN